MVTIKIEKLIVELQQQDDDDDDENDDDDDFDPFHKIKDGFIQWLFGYMHGSKYPSYLQI